MVSDLGGKLEDMGHRVGERLLDLIVLRERPYRRDTKMVQMLQFVSGTVWKVLFGKPADALEKSAENEDEYHIHESMPVTNRFVSVPKDMGNLNCAAFIAGVVRGVLNSAGFKSTVSAHTVAADVGVKTVYLVKFDPEVMAREAR